MDTIKFEACGRYWALMRPGNMDSLLEEIAAEGFKDDRLPYWVELWPASLSLGEWLEKNKELISGQFCLDLGCGLGYTAQLGSYLGAKVLAMDYEHEALFYARKSTDFNKINQPLWINADWNKIPIKAGSITYMWASDIMYEREAIDPLLRFIKHALNPMGSFWLADPDRNFYAEFNKDLRDIGFVSEKREDRKVRALEGHDVTVQIWEIKRRFKGL